MEKLSQILWRERELLDTLLFKLEEEQMVLASGRTRWLVCGPIRPLGRFSLRSARP